MANPRVRTLTQVSLANFENRMTKLAQRAVRKSNEGMKEVALATINALITDTPKKTGQAAANWQAAIGVLPDFKPGYTDIPGARAAARAVIDARKPGDRINISNATPYIGLLNQGSSQQAPAMFVEKALARARQQVKRVKLLEE